METDQERTRRVAIEATISHIVDILETASAGVARENREASLSLKGAANAVLKRREEIVKQVQERLGDIS